MILKDNIQGHLHFLADSPQQVLSSSNSTEVARKIDRLQKVFHKNFDIRLPHVVL